MNFLKKLFKVTPIKLSLAITLVFAGLSIVYDMAPNSIHWLSTMADKSLDNKFVIRGPSKPKNKIVIVAGDDRSFAELGQWPWDRGTVFAPMFETICKYNPKALGLDLVWSEHEHVLPGAVRQSLSTSFAEKGGSLDEVLARNSGDALMRRSIESCGSKIVLGYALGVNDSPDNQKKEFQKRIDILTHEPRNVISSASKGKIIYSRRRDGDPEANVSFYQVGKSGLLNVPEITPEHVAQGFMDNDGDRDGNYRRATLFWRTNDAFVPSLAMRMAQKYLSPNDTVGKVTIEPEIPEQNRSMHLAFDIDLPSGKRSLPIDLLGQTVVNFRGPNYTFPNVSLADVIRPGDTINYDQFDPATGVTKSVKTTKAEFFKDALVLVGLTAQAIYDIRPRPFDSQASGVENHANIIDNLISDDFIVRPTNELIFLILAGIILGGVLFGFTVSKLDAKWGAVFALLTIGAYAYADQVVFFERRNIILFSYINIIQLVFQYLAITVLKYMQEESEKKFIRSAFDKYVSPDVINQMIDDPTKLKIGGDKKELTIMFSDIRGFTTLSERLDVKALSQFLNEYLGSMTDILQANRGTLDKYIGDAVMGFWGAPLDSTEHARLAVKTAIEMVAKLAELNKEFEKKYGLAIDIGIGINTGPVTVGNFGSSKVFSYTVIGDNVNLASRLEGINKYYGTHVIVSEMTYAQLPQGEFLTREVDTVKVKGKHKPVKIYEVFPDDATHEPLKNALQPYNEGLRHYYARQWEQAMQFFANVLKLRDGDKTTLEMIERCKHYLTNPPEADWDGSWEMHSK